MKKNKNLIWGIILIVLGIIWGGKVLGIININLFFRGWWTLFIIIPSFIGLFTDREKVGSLIGILIGVLLLLSVNDIVDFDLVWKLLLPAIVIIIGLSLVFKNTISKEVNDNIKKLNDKLNDNDGYAATFSSQDVTIDEEFKGTSLNAIFGGIKFDLRKAKIKDDVVINATSIFGGIDIFVSEGVKIKVKSTAIFGGVSNKKHEESSDNAKTIYINATCMFGGVDIK